MHMVTNQRRIRPSFTSDLSMLTLSPLQAALRMSGRFSQSVDTPKFAKWALPPVQQVLLFGWGNL